MHNEARRPLRRVPLVAFLALLAGCATPLPDPQHDTATPAAAPAAEVAQRRLQRALQALQQRPPNVARARNQLGSLLASRDEDARALHPYARVLLEQLNERQRLGAANERLTQQLGQHAQELAASQARSEELQRKLDALAEIERSLPPRAVPARGESP